MWTRASVSHKGFRQTVVSPSPFMLAVSSCESSESIESADPMACPELTSLWKRYTRRRKRDILSHAGVFAEAASACVPTE